MLTDPRALRQAAEDALALGRARAASGTVARYIPELANADPAAVALAVHTVDGTDLALGDAQEPFTLQSVSKVFALATLLRSGDSDLWSRVDQEPSGDAFHSIVRLEEESGRPRNPFINAGAIVVSGRLPGGDTRSRIAGLRRLLQDASGASAPPFAVHERTYLSECRTGFRNRALAHYMRHHGVVEEPDGAVDTYFRQCALQANVHELARAGLFLANGGVDPESGRRVLSRTDTRTVVALMTTCGLYDEVGNFAVRAGVPTKSGVSGGMLAIVPGRMAIATYGPALGPRGNSVAGVEMVTHLADVLGLSIFGGP